MKKLLLMVMALMSGFNYLKAQTYQTWRIEATNNIWQTDGNWWNFPNESAIVFGQQEWDNNHYVDQSNTADISTWRFKFQSGATNTHTFSGNQISFFDYSDNDPGIINESSATHIINNNINGDDNGDPFFVDINNNGGGGLTFGGTFNNNGSPITVGGTASSVATITFNGIISGSAGFEKNNSSVLVIFNAANTFTGQLTVNAGTVRLGSSGSSFGNGDIRIASSGTLDLNGFNVTVSSIAEVGESNGGVITLGDGILTVDQASGILYQNSISGTGGLIKQGSGTLSLYGTQSYTGATTVSGGTLSTNVSMSTSEVTVQNGATLSITGNVTISSITIESGGTLNVDNGNTLTVSELNNAGTITGTGTITFQNTITGNEGWRILSSPVSGATYADLLDPFWTQGIATGADATNGTANVMTYDGTSLTAVTDLTETLSAGQGFIAYIFSDDDFDDDAEGFPKTISVTGTENAGPVSPTLTSGASAWSLLGNPYASTINWDLFTTTGMLGTVYVYDHGYTAGPNVDVTNLTGGAFRAWNGLAGGLTDGSIAPFQGFWVQNAALGTPTLSIPTAAKTTGGTFYKTAVVPSIELAAKMGHLYSTAYFSFNETASEGMDSRDAYKLTPLDFKNYLSLSTQVEGNSIDINNLPLNLSAQVRIPLTVDAFEADIQAGNWKTMGGEVTLTWPTTSTIPSGWVVQLEDNQTGAIVNLLEESEYSFTLEPPVAKVAYNANNLGPKQVTAVNSSRFSVVIGPITTSVRELSEVPNAVILHQNYPNPFNPSTQIAFELPQAMNVSVTVFDMLGREVATLLNGSAKAGYNTVSWNASNVGSGIYYYRLVAGENTITKKMTLVK